MINERHQNKSFFKKSTIHHLKKRFPNPAFRGVWTFRTIKNDWCVVCSWFCCRCKALTLGQLLDTNYVMFWRIKNFLGAVEVKKFSKIQYIRNLRSGLTDTRDFKITFFVCLSFNKKIGGTWSPPDTWLQRYDIRNTFWKQQRWD